jgi:exopolysaccharide biosynthesis polyprenyl glycosylphosphotransferase
MLAGLLGGVVAVAIGAFLPVPWGPRPVVMGLLAAGGIILARAALYAIVRWLRQHYHVNRRLLIVGASEAGKRIAAVLRDHPEHGLRPRAFWDPDPLLARGRLEVPLLPLHMSLPQAINATRAQTVIIAHGGYTEAQIIDVLRTTDRFRCQVFLVPRFYEMALRSADMDEIWGLPLLRLRRPSYQRPDWGVKRVVDIAVSALLLLLVAPLMVGVAIAVRFEGGPGILFRQLRVGRDGRLFQLLKFRTMRPANEADSATTWTISGDPRVGRVGRMLRKSSLDELPQFWNVLRGDMTLVGPRPERPYYVDQFAVKYPNYAHRHRVPAGITGWAQIHGLRGDTSIGERAQFDNYYIENWTLWTDAKIMLQTLPTLVRRPGA